MIKSSRIVPRAFMGVLTICSIALLVFLTMPVQASYVPQNAFTTEVLLNKSNITYDLSLFENYAENGSVNIEEDKWEPGTYYIYRSHFNLDLGVIIHEVKEEWIDLCGLSISLAIPTKWDEVTREWDTATLELDFEFELNETLITFMESKGYEKSGERNLTMSVFSKNDITIYLKSGEGDKRPEEPTDPGNNVIWVEGAKGTLDASIDQDLKDMLEFLSIDPNEWDNAIRESHSGPYLTLVPSVNLEPDELDWNTAMCTELEWLMNQSIVKGLTSDDIQEIGMKAKAGYTGWNFRIVYENGTWMPYDKTEDPMLISVPPPGFQLNLDDLPPDGRATPITQDGFHYSTMVVVGGFVVLMIFGAFSYTRLKRKHILDNLNRKNIYESIKANPGIHVKALRRDLNLKPGTLSHHLNVLEKEEYIKSRQDGMYRRFYLYEAKSDLKIVLTSIQQRILSAVNERPGSSQSNISRTIGSNRMLVNYHMKILRDAGILAFEKSGRESLCYTTSISMFYLPG